MKKIIIATICFFIASAIFSQDLFKIPEHDNEQVQIKNYRAKLYRVSDVDIDTFSVFHILQDSGFSLVCFSEKWCQPSYREFNRLYNDGIIDFLKDNNSRLIVIAERYPFLNVNQLDSLAKKNIEADFEIYYSSENLMRSFPSLWLIAPQERLLYHSVGVKDDYSQIKESIKQYKKNRCPRCTRCKGTGRVTPNRLGGPDESVGICPRCGGRGLRY